MLTFINFCRCTFYYQINQKVKNVFALHKHMQQLFNVGNIPIRNTSCPLYNVWEQNLENNVYHCKPQFFLYKRSATGIYYIQSSEIQENIIEI